MDKIIPTNLFIAILLLFAGLKCLSQIPIYDSPNDSIFVKAKFYNRYCCQCYYLPKDKNYNSILLGNWCTPHGADYSFLFKSDGTFCGGGCEDECNDRNFAKGTYIMNGPDGLFKNKDGSKKKFHIFCQDLSDVEQVHTSDQPIIIKAPYRYVVAIYDSSHKYYDILIPWNER